MNMKLKALGLALVAAMAMGAFAVVNASATVSGHFEAEADHTIITGTEQYIPANPETKHFLVFREHTGGEAITCTHASYEGTVTTKTTTTVEVTPTYEECSTGGKGPHNIGVTMNDCTYTFHSNATTHGTVTIDCPRGEAIEIHHPNCTMTVPAQAPGPETMKEGVTYDTITTNGKHALTATVTVKTIEAEYHGGICIFLGTNHKFDMTGSATVWGEDTTTNPLHVTHT